MTSTNRARSSWTIGVVLGLAACAQEGGAAAASNESRREATAAALHETPRVRDTGPPAVSSFPAETQAFMKDGLHQFGNGDPRWEATRAKWLAMGPDESDFLVTTMWAALLRFQGLNDPVKVEKTRHELGAIGEPAVPLMAAFLTGGTIYSTTDPESGERRDVVIDDMARDEAARVLGLIGAPAIPAVRDALANASSKAGSRFALQTLGYIGDRGGAAATEPLREYARSEDDVLRIEAVYAMRYCHDDATRAALLEALGDREELVRRKAAEALMNRRDAGAVASIRAAAARARSEAKLVEAAELERTAVWIEQHPK